MSWVYTLSSVQSLSHVWFFVTPWSTACQASLSISNSWGLLKLMSIELVMPSNHLILCHSLLLPPSIFPSIRVFASESVLCIRWPTYWSFSFSISPSSDYSGLISFMMDWLDLLAVQDSLKSLLQHHRSKASILWHTLVTDLYNECLCAKMFLVRMTTGSCDSHPFRTQGLTAGKKKPTVGFMLGFPNTSGH